MPWYQAMAAVTDAADQRALAEVLQIDVDEGCRRGPRPGRHRGVGMSGYGGITVAMMPNGATYYYFSDSGTFAWAVAVKEATKLRSHC